MSTRGIFTFRDDDGMFHVYKHSDSYLYGGLHAVCNAIPFAWTMPRFEADEFAAAFIAGNKGALSEAALLLKTMADKLPDPGFMVNYEVPGPVTLSRHYRDYNGGGIRLLSSGENVHWHDAAPGDVEYHYDIHADGEKLIVTCSRIKWNGEERTLNKIWSEDILPYKDRTWKDWCDWGSALEDEQEAA